MRALDYKLYYFLGIGGIGMSALARYFNHYKKVVCGYDKISTSLTKQMEKEGIPCHYEEDVLALKNLLSKYKKEEIAKPREVRISSNKDNNSSTG